MKNLQNVPFYVKIGLLGIETRKTAFAYFWFSIFLAIICFVAGFFDKRYFAGVLLLLAALWYWICIKSVDKIMKW